MYIRLKQIHRVLPVILGLVTLASVGVLLAWDAFPHLFPPKSHNFLGAFPLAMIAFAYTYISVSAGLRAWNLLRQFCWQ